MDPINFLMRGGGELESFWVVSLLNRLPFKYYYNSFLIGFGYVALVWILGLIIPNAFSRVYNDLGLYLVSISFILVLISIYKYVTYLKDFLLGSTPDIFEIEFDDVRYFWRLSTGQLCTFFGFFGILLANAILYYKGAGIFGPGGYTGFSELPYSGSLVFAMKYTSLPLLLITSIFWLAFEFLAGNIFWLNISLIILLLRFHGYRSKVSSVIDYNLKVYLNRVGRLIIYCVLMPTVAMFMTPTVFTMPQTLGNLFSVSFYGYCIYLAYIVLLVVMASLVIYRWVDSIKENELNSIRPVIMNLRRRLMDREALFDNDSALTYLLIMHFEDKIRGESVFPMTFNTLYKLVSIVFLPLIVQLLAQFISVLLNL